MDRRAFLRSAALLGGAAAITPSVLAACSGDDGSAGGGGGDDTGAAAPADRTSLLDRAASEAPIDTVVVVMMENRSFDHYLGWLTTDEAYLERGRSRYGGAFTVDGQLEQEFTAADGTTAATRPWLEVAGESNPYRGCGHPDPGHNWDEGRAQRDGGFVAAGSGNDAYALGWYDADALPFSSRLAREFTVFDRWHASLLGPTFPNRNYLHSAQSPSTKTNALPTATGGYPWETVWDRLGAANVPAGYYYTDLPNLALWGSRLSGFQHPIDDYFDLAGAGRLPNVVVVDPAFLTDNRTDDHPHADIRAGQRFLRDVFRAFVESPQWERGLFVLTYDEWGGFYDHVAPPVLPDDNASTVDADNFGQAGFRVPTVMASPYARRGYVDREQYDHTAVMRFLEWRFLGAPPRGPGADGDTWFLSARDRNAANLGSSLLLDDSDPEPGFDLEVAIDAPSPPCVEAEGPGASLRVVSEVHPFEQAMREGWYERVGHRVRPSAMAKEWASG